MDCTFTDDPDIDAVLLTHSHYDHDPSYYTGESVPVLTEPGSFRAGDLEFGVV
jgi:metal-dependent hydrolase (beta-lactamase superfamily II)